MRIRQEWYDKDDVLLAWFESPYVDISDSIDTVIPGELPVARVCTKTMDETSEIIETSGGYVTLNK